METKTPISKSFLDIIDNLKKYVCQDLICLCFSRAPKQPLIFGPPSQQGNTTAIFPEWFRMDARQIQGATDWIAYDTKPLVKGLRAQRLGSCGTPEKSSEFVGVWGREAPKMANPTKHRRHKKSNKTKIYVCMPMKSYLKSELNS